jgi:hypothetical protein
MANDPLAGLLPGTTGNADPDTAGVAGSAGVAQGQGTGRYGWGHLTGGAGMVGNAVEDVWSWLNKPFQSPLSPVDVFLMVGAVLVAVLLWNLILFHIRMAAETV